MKGISARPGVPILFVFGSFRRRSFLGELRFFECCRRWADLAQLVWREATACYLVPRLGRMGKGIMVVSQAETLRKAIENLIDAKLHDALSRPGGLERLTAHRVSGVASFDIRNAERKLQQTLAEILSGEPVNS
jgi:hypothetical protein